MRLTGNPGEAGRPYAGAYSFYTVVPQGPEELVGISDAVPYEVAQVTNPLGRAKPDKIRLPPSHRQNFS